MVVEADLEEEVGVEEECLEEEEEDGSKEKKEKYKNR